MAHRQNVGIGWRYVLLHHQVGEPSQRRDHLVEARASRLAAADANEVEVGMGEQQAGGLAANVAGRTAHDSTNHGQTAI